MPCGASRVSSPKVLAKATPQAPIFLRLSMDLLTTRTCFMSAMSLCHLSAGALAVHRFTGHRADKPGSSEVPRLMALLANRDFAYLVGVLALVNRLEWFIVGASFGTYLFALYAFTASYTACTRTRINPAEPVITCPHRPSVRKRDRRCPSLKPSVAGRTRLPTFKRRGLPVSLRKEMILAGVYSPWYIYY
jgi:hypothetical protein